MASTTFCDWCGEIMEIPDGDRPLTFQLAGHGGTPTSSFTMFKAMPFHYHAEWHYDGEMDPDCCLAQVRALLRERASWAHDPEQGSREWRLVPRNGRIETARENRYRKRIEEDEAREARRHRWKAIPKADRHAMIRAAVEAEPATVSELERRLSEQHDLPSCLALRHIVNEMYATGTLDREQEEWQPGRTRYRYSLAANEEVAA